MHKTTSNPNFLFTNLFLHTHIIINHNQPNMHPKTHQLYSLSQPLPSWNEDEKKKKKKRGFPLVITFKTLGPMCIYDLV